MRSWPMVGLNVPPILNARDRETSKNHREGDLTIRSDRATELMSIFTRLENEIECWTAG